MEKDGENSNKLQKKIQPQPRNLGKTLHPSGILMDPTKNKTCDRTKTASN
jgi:hypothetical protein